MIFLRNIVIVPRDEDMAAARDLVSADLEVVFGSEEEFINHHRRKVK